MENVELKVLTEKTVKSDALKKLGFAAACHLGSFVGFSAVVAWWVYIIKNFFQMYFEEGNRIAIVGAVIFIAMLIYLLIGFIYHFCKFIVTVVNLSTVAISGCRIVEDKLVNSDSQEYSSLKRHATFLKSRHCQYTDGYQEVMYFHKYGREVLSGFELISNDYGDIFYLAVYGKKNKIIKAYNTKEYKINYILA